MTNDQISLILNQYQYRNRTNWTHIDKKGFNPTWELCFHNSAYEQSFFWSSSVNQGENALAYHLDKFGALAICEKLIKQSSDDDLKTIVLSITQPLKDQIQELIAENLSNQTQYIEQLESLEKIYKEEIEALKRRIKQLDNELKDFDRGYYNK